MLNDWSFVLAVAIMATATFASRIAGPILMSRVTWSAKTERFLQGLAVSVISALVASQLMTSDERNIVAVVVAVLVMLFSQSVVRAMFAGMIAAAAAPFIAPI